MIGQKVTRSKWFTMVIYMVKHPLQRDVFNSKSCEVDNVVICVLDSSGAHFVKLYHLTFIFSSFGFYSSRLAHFATSSSWHPNLFRIFQ
mgnify:CR=1 FL=1